MAQIFGSNSSETIAGTIEPDTISSLGGSDRVAGSAGADVISGGDGSDVISGGAGDDVIYGHSAADLDENSGAIRSTLLTNVGQGALFFTSAPGDEGFGYALNKNSGEITRVNTETGSSTTFLDTPDGEFSAAGEGGVLGLAFHPAYAANGRFFIFRTDAAGDIEILEYRRSSDDPTLADPTPVQTILTIPHPTFTNHNGGFIGFGPDGYLYATVGDGGAANDPEGDAQNLDNLLGKVLRIDVNSDDFAADPQCNYAIPDDNPFVGAPGADEIWAYGLRNPWRMSFDSATGDLYIADVGQGRREEINFEAAGSGGGLNYGWNYREGTIDGPAEPPGPIALTEPIFDYAHFTVTTPSGTQTRGSVTGGYVYHGPAPGLQGAYFFADFTTDRLFTLRVVDGIAEDAIERTAQITGDTFGLVTSFGVDGAGNLYVVSFTGGIYRLDPSAAAGDGHDRLRGDEGDDTLRGGVGDDFLNGGADDDALFGGRGHDLLIGGGGNDTMDGGEGNDTASYAQALGPVTVKLAFTAAQDTGGAGVDIVRNIENLIGSRHDDLLIGTAGANILDGRGGADILRGLGGDDLYLVDNAGDRVQELAGGGYDEVRSSVTFNLGPNLEKLLLLGGAHINGYGGALDNVLIGNGGDNILNGGAGDDWILGGGGADRLIGGLGRDVLDAGADAVGDAFVFFSADDSGTGAARDVLRNFHSGEDRIFLNPIDADTTMDGNQAFAFSATGPQAHSIWTTTGGGNTLLSADVNGDAVSDFELLLVGVTALGISDVVL